MTEFILNAIAWGGYLGIFLLMAAENVIPPIPSEVIMGLGGIAVARGDMALAPLIGVGTAGTVIGNCFWYWLGRRFGYQGLRPFVERHGRWLTLDWSDVERIRGFFHARGGWTIFIFRFMPAFRTIISLPAGMARMPLPRFLLFTAGGSAIWNTVLAAAGLYLGYNFEALQQYIGPAVVGSFVLIGLVYVYRVATWRPRG